MTSCIRPVLVWVAAPLGLAAILVRPVVAGPDIWCPSLPAPTSVSHPDPLRAQDPWPEGGMPAALQPRACAPPTPAAILSQAGAVLNVTWDPLRLIGYRAPGLVLDSLRDRLVLYGGNDGYGRVSGDVWTKPLSGEAPWTRLAVPQPLPPARSAHTTIYDPVRDRLIVYGGYCWDSCAVVWALPLSGSPAWIELARAGSGPGHRTGARAVYDPAGDRMIVFGGYSYETDSLRNDVWALSLSGTPTWTLLSPAGAPPSPRTEEAAIYDPIRRRMVIFGGSDNPDAYTQAVRDVWALSLGDSLRWTELHPGGDVVLPLYACASAYDSARDRMIVFGGRDTVWYDPPHRETWALQFGDSLSWTQLAPPDPQPSAGASARAVYDPPRDRLVLYGVSNEETWALSFADGPVWTLLEGADSRPAGARYLHAAAYDSSRRRMLVFGGESAYYAEGDYRYTAHNDLWSLSFDPRPHWEPLARDSVPSPRHGHSAIVDPVADRMVIYGGGSYPGGFLTDELWQLPLSGVLPWSRLHPDSAPPGRYLHSAVYDPARRRMIVFGGCTASSIFSDKWLLSLDGAPRWTRLDVDAGAPPARWGHSALYDPVGDRMIVFGGYDGTTWLDDTWQLSLAGTSAWSPLPSAARPPARQLASMVYDSYRQRVVLFGGQGVGAVPLGDTWVLPLGHSTGWTPASAQGASPEGRWGATTIFDPDVDRVVIFGGARDRCGDGLDHAWLMSSDVPSPAIVALVSVQAMPGGIALTWKVTASPGFRATVQRRTGATAWTDLGTVRADGAGLMRYEDRTAARGGRYAYRLAWLDGIVVQTTPEVWADMPLLPFSLAGATPNPATRGLTVSFWLPDGAAARLDVVDVAGRRVVSREVGTLGLGPHVLDVDPARALPPGVYLLRLTRGRESLIARACVVW